MSDSPQEIATAEHQPRRIVALQSSSRVWLFAIPWTAAYQAFLFLTSSQSLLRFMSIESVMLSSHLILCRLLLFLPSVFPSIGVFSNELAKVIWTPVSVLPINIQHWFPLGLTGLSSLLIQGTLKSLLQHYNSKASVLQCSIFFMVQLSHLYRTTGKT